METRIYLVSYLFTIILILSGCQATITEPAYRPVEFNILPGKDGPATMTFTSEKITINIAEKEYNRRAKGREIDKQKMDNFNEKDLIELGMLSPKTSKVRFY